MNDVLSFADEPTPTNEDQRTPWKILIADDEPSVHLVTKLALGDFTFEGRRLDLLSAYSEADTQRLLDEHADLALVLLDVVMDTMDSGFALVRYIRETLGNKDIRIIMRTGQSGNAPEDRIIIDYDINDFKDKTELTVAKLRTTMISSLRTYSHLKIIAEEQRKSSANRAYLHTVIDSLSSVLITLDLELQVLLWNREAHRWTGVRQEDAVGYNLFEVAPVFTPLKALLLELLSPASPDCQSRVERTAVPLWKDGQVFVHLILQTLLGSNGPEILFRLDDRTVSKLQDDRLVQNQKVSAFGALATGIAQELSALPLSADADSGLLARLSQFSLLADHKREITDWASAVQSAMDSLATPGIEVNFQTPISPAWVRAQAEGLQTLTLKLLENAFDALANDEVVARKTPRVITIRLTNRELTDTELKQHPDQSEVPYWCLTVGDNGPGMTPEVVDQVFDPYFTTKLENSGLGLGFPLAASLAETLGGFVDVGSAPGAGTQVKVWLPAWQDAADEAQQTPSSGTTILLCDDEPMMRHVAGRILRHLGFEVLEASDGIGAVEMFHTHKTRINLVILDMVLPGLSGLEVFKQIHAAAPHVPILLSSGFGRGAEVEEAMELGVARFLQKPYRAEALGEAVLQALSGPGRS